MSDETELNFFSRLSYEQGKSDELERVKNLISNVYAAEFYQDNAFRDKDFKGDPNFEIRMKVLLKFYYLLTGESLR